MTHGKQYRNLFLLIILFLAVPFLLQGCRTFRVTNNSMSPTLNDGDLVPAFYFKKITEPSRLRGKIIIFKFTGQDELYIKRCIGVPGDSICISDGICYNNLSNNTFGDTIHINNDNIFPDFWCVITNNRFYQDDNILNICPIYIPQKGDTIQLSYSQYKLYRHIIEYECYGKEMPYLYETYIFKENYYFMCGDNMLHSTDSRQWGFVPESLLIARTFS